MIYHLLRIPNLILTFLSVLIGGWVGLSIDPNPKLLLAGIIAAVVCAFGNIYNDIVDLPIDTKNNPNRPLPSGKIKLKTAWIFAIMSFIVSVLLSIKLGLLPIIIVFTALVLLYVYSRWLKLTPWANITVAVVASLSFLLGGIVQKNIYCLSIVPLSISYHFSRELVKDIIDLRWDRTYGSQSIPILIGIDKAKLLSIIIIILFSALLPLPYLVGAVSRYYLYLAAIIIPINVIIIRFTLDERKKLGLVSKLIKLGMILALAAVLLGTII